MHGRKQFMRSVSYCYLLPIFQFRQNKRPFSRMALKQVHEQNNKIKGLEGVTSILNTQDESPLIRWKIRDPEVAGIVSEFGDSLYDQDPCSSTAKHHEDNYKLRQKLSSDVEFDYFIKEFQ